VKEYKSLTDIQSDISGDKITLRDLVLHYLGNIEKQASLNAFLEVYGDEALQRADLIQDKIKQGRAGKLAGMVIALKDNICYKGHHVSASSKILQGFESVYSATVVERLLAEDAIIIGRTNCDEFAMGASNENSAYGPVHNALDPERVSGGSSGGSAVSVQSDCCLAALGSDTGGSVRQPAAFCGVYGLKPTYGRVSRYGLIAYASSFDQIGTFTKSVTDSRKLMEVMAGKDPMDATTSEKPVLTQSNVHTQKKFRISYIRECIEHEGIDPDVKAATMKLIQELREKGHEVNEISFPYLEYLVPVYYVLTTAEASSNLSRFSGMLYGHRSDQGHDLDSMIRKSRSEGFGTEVKRRIMLGTFVLSAGYFDAYYTKAQQVRRLVQDKTEALLREADFILSPTTPTAAFKLGEKAGNPIAMYLADLYTVHANISGHPALSFPYGSDKNGMPIGMQLMSDHFNESALLDFTEVL
jgi:aspartyl-tRNA(Asn)/glutamyl-tRNA(Gln) amidotransferase subunit A